ncbi:hypothetical protein Pst134EA_015350 [Puccinia striiformis f. sp. tritici]|uniref:hypothetical protein n=1 Tax=Puccinia striiformis f. sp. tritici TaxID=168172 RepID=UPI00200832DC|nr:hypothetical protein Pst134EA_015350 [Puccinia striiformis f. sp. tritici]KAH9463265.1 hypothetical protein Pst134EA_015350 [Puccinia striiformis f. sp. tritici]
MAFQEATQGFVELLQQLGSTQPSLNDGTKACEELKFDILENHFALMKVEYKERQSQLTAKMNKGESLTADEEEWLDVEGNLVRGELLISHLSTISSASSNQSICLSSDDVKTVLEINNFRPKDSTKLTLQKKAVTKKNQLKQIPTSRKQSQPTKVLA